jgi:hypothetical protein
MRQSRQHRIRRSPRRPRDRHGTSRFCPPNAGRLPSGYQDISAACSQTQCYILAHGLIAMAPAFMDHRIYSALASVSRICSRNDHYNQCLTSKFPTQRNRELIGPYQGIKSAYQGSYMPDQGRVKLAWPTARMWRVGMPVGAGICGCDIWLALWLLPWLSSTTAMIVLFCPTRCIVNRP